MNPTERFSGRAVAYAQGRPSYPAEAIDVLFDGLGDPSSLVAVDLGAGTGISSRLLAERGARVTAIEPNASMRERGGAKSGVEWCDATAEATRLESHIVDLAVAFQAFHWFDRPAVLHEIERILRPTGRAALVYNERDERDPFTAAYGDVVRRYATDETERRREDARSAFVAWPAWRSVRVVEISNEQRLDRAGIHARANSTSYLPTHGDEAERLHAELDALFDEHAVDGDVALRLKTTVTLAELGDSARAAAP